MINGHSMKPVYVSILLALVGIILVVMPDHGPVLIRLNADHGPSFVDVVGLSLIVTGWFLMILKVWRSRKDVRRAIGSTYFKLSLCLIALCTILIPLALRLNSDVLLFSSASVSLVCQVVLMSVAIRSRFVNINPRETTK